MLVYYSDAISDALNVTVSVVVVHVYHMPPFGLIGIYFVFLLTKTMIVRSQDLN